MEDAQKKERLTVSLSPDVYRLLREFAFYEGVRTPNTAASEIIAGFVLEWDERRGGREGGHGGN